MSHDTDVDVDVDSPVSGVTLFLCQCISAAALTICIVMKGPQIWNIMKAGSSRGINLTSLLMECWCFSVLVAYPISKGYQIRTYVEMIPLNIQDLILLLMVLRDRKLLNVFSIAAIVAYISVLVGLATHNLPGWLLAVMVTTVTPMAAGGKLMQAFSIWRSKDAGTVSPLSWGLGALTASGRIFTGLVEIGDMYLVFLSAQAAVLNGTICISALYFRKPSRSKTD